VCRQLSGNSPLMPHARLIICEKNGRWAVALRREIAGKCRVFETRSLEECWEELAKCPASWLVLEASETNVEPLAGRLANLGRDFAGARAMICGERNMAPWEWLLREAGAVHAVFSPRELAPAARMALCHLAQAPEPQRSFREHVWDRLPWNFVSTRRL
jgi:hypothetical protein